MATTFEKGGLETIADGVHVYVGPGGSSNNGIILTEEGTISVDSFVTNYDGWMHTFEQVTNRAVSIAINTHDDADHFSMNHYFRRQGATIIASEVCRARIEKKMNTGRWIDDLKSRNPERTGDITDTEELIPHIGLQGQATLNIAGEKIELVPLGHGHCPGDMVVHFPERGVLFAGDLVFAGVHGRMKTTDVDAMIAVLDHMLTISCKTVVPGHGAPIKGVNAEAIETYKHYTASLRDRIAEMINNGVAVEQMEAELQDWQYKDWKRPQLFPICIGHVYKDVLWRSRFQV